MKSSQKLQNVLCLLPHKSTHKNERRKRWVLKQKQCQQKFPPLLFVCCIARILTIELKWKAIFPSYFIHKVSSDHSSSQTENVASHSLARILKQGNKDRVVNVEVITSGSRHILNHLTVSSLKVRKLTFYINLLTVLPWSSVESYI